MRIDPLVPENHYPILPSAGVPRATAHEWVETREIAPLAEGCRSYEFLYKCLETGAIRRWGYVDLDQAGRLVH